MDDNQLTNHEAKTQTLTDYYKAILGVHDQPIWNFDVAALYPAPNYDLSDLVAPFNEDEAMQAMLCMNINNAPGPDGFGPAWYSSAWSVAKEDVMQLLWAFQHGVADLNRINRAHIVLVMWGRMYTRCQRARDVRRAAEQAARVGSAHGDT